MAGLRDLNDNAEFQKLSPEARAIVVDKISANDEDFARLSPEAQTIVKTKLSGATSTTPKPAGGVPVAGKAEPLAPAMWDSFKKGLAGAASLPGLMGDTLVAPLKAVQHVGSLVTDKIPKPDYLEATKVWQDTMRGVMGVEDKPVPKNEYGKESKSNEYLMKGAEFLGAGLVPGVGVVSMAERKLIAGITELAATVISSFSAVEGKEIGKNLAPKLGVEAERGALIGEALGSLAGPGAVAATSMAVQKATNKVASTVSDATGITGVSKEAQANAGKAMAIKQIKESLDASPASKGNLQEAVDLQGQIPGFKPTLGQSSGAPGVVAIENKIASSHPQSLAKAAERETENVAAIKGFAQDKFPDSTPSPTRPVENRYQQIVKAQQAKLDATQQQITKLAARQETTDTASIGERLRELRAEAQVPARAIKNAAYQDVYQAANKAGLKADVSDVQTLMREVAGSDEQAAQLMPGVYSDMSSAIKGYKPKEGPQIVDASGKPFSPTSTAIEVPFEALHSMQKRASNDLNAALAAGDGNKAYLIGKVRDSLTDKIKAFEGAEYGDVAEKLAKANKANAEYSRIFKEGLGGKIGPYAMNKYGKTTNDEDVVRKLIFNPENKRGTQEFFDIYGSSPEAHKLLKDGVTDMFAKATVRDGEIKPALVETFIRQHKQQLDMLPEIKAKLQNTDKMNDALLARRSAIIEQQKAVDKSVIAKLAKSDDPDAVIKSALTNLTELKILTAQALKTKDGTQSLARSIADAVSQQKNPLQFLTENETTLKPILNRLGPAPTTDATLSHFDNLKTLAKAEEMMGRVKSPTHVQLDKLKDLGEQTIGTSGKGILSRLMNVNKGYASAEYVTFDLGGRYIYKIKTEEANKIMEAAIYDPEMAKALVNMPKQTAGQAINSMKSHALSHGIRVEAVGSNNAMEQRK